MPTMSHVQTIVDTHTAGIIRDAVAEFPQLTLAQIFADAGWGPKGTQIDILMGTPVGELFEQPTALGRAIERTGVKATRIIHNVNAKPKKKAPKKVAAAKRKPKAKAKVVAKGKAKARANGNKPTSQVIADIVAAYTQGAKFSTQDVAKASGVSVQTARRNIGNLTGITAKGTRRDAHWVVTR